MSRCEFVVLEKVVLMTNKRVLVEMEISEACVGFDPGSGHFFSQVMACNGDQPFIWITSSDINKVIDSVIPYVESFDRSVLIDELNSDKKTNSQRNYIVKKCFMGHENIVRYWHSVELLQPQAAPKLEKRSNLYSALIHDTSIERPILPWTIHSVLRKHELPKAFEWSHTLYAHLYDSRLVAEKLKKTYGADQGYQEPQYRESALFSAKFSMAGQMVNNSFVLSSEAWFLGRVLTGQDWKKGFEDDQTTASNQAHLLLTGQDWTRCIKDVQAVASDQAHLLLAVEVSSSALRELTQWVLQFLGIAEFFGDMDQHQFRFCSQPVKLNKTKSEDDPLNSFLLRDLANVANNLRKGVLSAPLNQYLSRHDPKRRLHVDNNHASLAMIDRLMPDAYANSCWPSERHLGLVHSQQLAVNTILTTLSNSQGLLGINGPPGTGKTTLLRDLIASIVTSRADALATFGRASDVFATNGREQANDGGKPQFCYKLNPALYGFEIVVASSNNGAVENVTLELPQRDKIDESWLPEAEYFAELGELTSGKPAWGLISGALGSKARRKKFVDSYFFGQRQFVSKNEADADSKIEEVSNLVPSKKSDNAANAQVSTPYNMKVDDGENDKQDNAPLENSKGPQGFMGWLNANAEINAARSPAQREVLWRQAICDYEAVKAEAKKACAGASQIRGLIQSICQTREKIDAIAETLSTVEEKLATAVANLKQLDTEESRPANLALKQCLNALKQHQTFKPSFWAKLFSLWGAQRDWNATHVLMTSEHALAFAEFTRITRLTKQLDEARKKLEKQTNETRQEFRQLLIQEKSLKRDATILAEACRAGHLVAWLQSDAIGRGAVVELAEPWCIEGWRKARARVFIQALKLHRTFFELEASRMRSNLFLINNHLTGTHLGGMSHDAIRSAWASLFMVVPVLSSTFASFARSFGSLRAGEIGWLMVDEAGQATPQAAVGALWRARRALMVGDPLQLKPIVTVSDGALEHMRTHFQVDAHWLPNRQSAQTLADAATPWGRMAGPLGDKTWVGLPLAVHRRCDKPMHRLANRIAYDGAMVYGTIAPSPEKETRSSLLTGWIHASGTSEGNWVPAEGKALQELLVLLLEDGVKAKDISVITPFKDVRNNLKQMVTNEMVSGTVHTMQGKEALVVILVLGGNTAGSGARNWAVSEPNLLNVAATRAKRRLYVIGDRNDWKDRALFCDVMDLLPLQKIPIREQKSTEQKSTSLPLA